MRKRNTTVILLSQVLIFSVLVLLQPSIGDPLVTSRTYTLDADFDEGVLVGVEHETVHDQLQLSEEHVTLPFIWVPNQEGTVSKVHTETGKELGRYWVAPFPSRPSRTTVDLQGSCWVGNRDAGTVVKIGLYEAGIYEDRNGNGICDTSQDLNDDGDITGSELLPWGEDECVLFEVLLMQGSEATYDPGIYDPINNPGGNPGIYDSNHWGTAPRGLAVDSLNNLWAGTWISSKYYYIDGTNGAILKSVDVAPHHAYGAVIDGNGILWSSGQEQDSILRLDTATDAVSILPIGHFVYGLGLDYANHLFASGWTDSKLSKVDISGAGTKMWTKPGPYSARGVTCTDDNNVWIAATNVDKVYRYDNDGTYIAEISVGNGPTGVAVDAAGKVWVCNLEDPYIKRIDPSTNTVDLEKEISGIMYYGGYHYSYSDMTGIMARTITTKIGTWTVDFDSEEVDTPWGKISWNGLEPSIETSITVNVRSSNDKVSWSGWETAVNGDWLSSTPDGRYLQIETTLQTNQDELSPILYDLTVNVRNQPPIANAGPDQIVEQTSFEGAEVMLDGSASEDPDNFPDPLTYTWTWDSEMAIGMNPTITFPLGTTEVTLTVFDGIYEDSDTVVITVVDTTPPQITFIDDHITLWPPNHKYHTIIVSDFISDVTDICDSEVDIEDVIITSVSSDEPENDGGDGNTLDDIIIVGPQEIELRSERLGGGNGRVYTINFKVTDASENTAFGSYEVWVPHDQGTGSMAIDDGPSAGYTVYNLVGDWVLRFTFGGHYDHDMTILSQESDGSFEGVGGYPSGGPYTHPWDVTGRTVGNFIEFTIIYTGGNPGYTVWAIGTMDLFGYMSGACDDSNSKHGTWMSLSGPTA